MAATPIQHASAPSHSSQERRWPWVIVAIGYFLPGVVGICVRQYLQSIGAPAMPWSQVGREFPVLAIASVFWALPFFLVARLARRLPLADSKNRGLLYGAFLGTALCEVFIFIGFWSSRFWLEAVYFGFAFLLIPIPVFLGTLLGGTLGFLIGWLVGRARD